jgi:hypothetical protein
MHKIKEIKMDNDEDDNLFRTAGKLLAGLKFTEEKLETSESVCKEHMAASVESRKFTYPGVIDSCLVLSHFQRDEPLQSSWKVEVLARDFDDNSQ